MRFFVGAFLACISATTIAGESPLEMGETDTLTQELAAKLAANSCFASSFTQQLLDTDGTVLQDSSGTVQAMQPNNLRWTINSPDSQVIVTDGTTLWRYEEDLEQLIVSSFEAQGAGLPARLLSGDEAVLAAYSIEKADTQYQLTPKTDAGLFTNLALAFGVSGISSLALTDSFQQITHIAFSESDIPCEGDELYSFIAPEGIDVIYE